MTKKSSNWPARNVEDWPTDKIKPNPKNTKRHSEEQVGRIAKAITEWGFTVRPLIDEKGVLIAGEGRWLAAKSLGLAEVPVIVARGWTALQKRAYLIADNRLTELGETDKDALRLELTELDLGGFDIDLTGFDLSDLNPAGGNSDPDEAPEPPKNPVTRLRDIWICGDHRILCGDATSDGDVIVLLDGAKPNLMVTDAPYGVNYEPAWRDKAAKKYPGTLGNRKDTAKGKVSNDNKADWREAWALFPGSVAYVWHGDLQTPAAVAGLQAEGFDLRAQIIWAKQQFIFGRGHYHFQHESAWYAVRRGKSGNWNGDRSQGTVWNIDKPRKSETGHSTQKPVECMARPMRNNSKPGEAVYDPFIGSGTSMIAAEMERRRCIGIDIDPAYVDVAVLRWQAFTGTAATLEDDGRTFDEIAAERLKPKRRNSASARRASSPSAA